MIPNYRFSLSSIRVHTAMYTYDSILFKWNIVQNILISGVIILSYLNCVLLLVGEGEEV